MKIVALHTDFRIYWPARLKALSDALTRRGDSLHVVEIAGKGSPYSFAKNALDHTLDWHILFPGSKPEELTGKVIEPELFKTFETINPDVILAGAIAFPSGALAVRWGQLHGTKVIVFDDSRIEAVKRSPLVNFIKQAVYRGVDAMFYPAPDWEATGRFWHFNKKEMFWGVDVVDNDFWAKPSTEGYKKRKYFVAVGRQIPKKNFDKIVRAYKIYADTTAEPIPLRLIGDGPERNPLVILVHELGLNDKVSFKPFLSQTELRDAYHNAYALTIASNTDETWGLVINEAMAAGCAIFASKQCGATNTLVKDGVNGFIFDCEDIEALSNAMNTFHKMTEDEKLKMGEKSKSIVSDWGLDKFANSTIAAIDYVACNHKRKTSILDRMIISRWKGQYRPI